MEGNETDFFFQLLFVVVLAFFGLRYSMLCCNKIQKLLKMSIACNILE